MYERFRWAVRRVLYGSWVADTSGAESGGAPADSTRAGGIDTPGGPDGDEGALGTDAAAVDIPESGFTEPQAVGAPAPDEASTSDDGRLTQGVLDTETLLDDIPVCVFVLSPDREVIHWNRAAEELSGTAREDVVGTDQVSVAFYRDGRRTMTLADEVAETSERADEEYGVSRSTDVSYTRYEDTSTMVDARGREVDIWFTAQPVYRDGEFAGVVGMVHDRSEDVFEREAVEELEAAVVELVESGTDRVD